MTREGVAVKHYSSLTTALDGGWVVNATPQLLYLREEGLVTTVQEAGWAQGLVLTGPDILASTAIQSLDLPAHS